MIDDNTRDAAEPSLACTGSIASPRNKLFRCQDDPPTAGVYVLAFWGAIGGTAEGMSARVARRGVPAWYARNGVELVPPDFWMPLPDALTDEEREVLGRVADDACYRAMDHTEQVVRKLLERSTVAEGGK